MIMKDPWMPSKSLRSFDLKLHKFRGSCSSYHCRQRITINREAIGERLWAFRICCWIRKQSMPEFHVLHYRANQQDTNILLVGRSCEQNFEQQFVLLSMSSANFVGNLILTTNWHYLLVHRVGELFPSLFLVLICKMPVLYVLSTPSYARL